MGTTVFKTNTYTGCNTSGKTCSQMPYTLPTRTAKARMITAQELLVVGCTVNEKGCPIWAYNYLKQSTSYGGTVNATSGDYWSMSVSGVSYCVESIRYTGNTIHECVTYYEGSGVHAVVAINK